MGLTWSKRYKRHWQGINLVQKI